MHSHRTYNWMVSQQYDFIYVLLKLNPFSQNIYLNGLFPVWLSLCAVKWPDWLNTSSQNKHLKGFARILLSLCVVKWADRINNFSQIDIHLAWIIHAGSNLLSLQMDILIIPLLSIIFPNFFLHTCYFIVIFWSVK